MIGNTTIGKWLTQFFLFAFITIVMTDPTNLVLHLKDKLFVILMLCCFVSYKPDLRYLPHLLIVSGSMLIGYLFAEMQNNPINYEVMASSFKSVAPMFLLLYIRNFDFIKASILPSVITTLVLLVLFTLAVSNPIFEKAIFAFVQKHDHMIMMTHRYFFGIKIFGMYYKTLISLAFSLFYVYYAFILQSRRRWLYVFLAIVLTIAFAISGSRSTFLLPFCLFGLTIYYRVSSTQYVRYFLYPAIALMAIFFVVVVILFASETEEASNVIKYAHLTSYKDLFSQHPEYIIFGQGPGTAFFSEGFQRMTTITEWTYIELVRNYGIMAIPILGVFCHPILRLYRYRNHSFTQGILFTYIVYILVAGTNPLLLSSTGMLMILSAYSYCEKVEKEQRETQVALQ